MAGNDQKTFHRPRKYGIYEGMIITKGRFLRVDSDGDTDGNPISGEGEAREDEVMMN